MDLSLTRDDHESRLEYLEEVNRFTIDALEMAASLGDFQSSLQKLDEPHAILKEMGSRIKRLIPFDAIAFYLVDEVTSDFYLGAAQPADQQGDIQQEVDFLIENGTFAWALRENRAVFVSTSDFRRKLVLDAMTTVSRTRGMFVGIVLFTDAFFAGDSDAAVQNFVSAFGQRYGAAPDYLAAQGYMVVRLITKVLETDPSITRAELLRRLQSLAGTPELPWSLGFTPESQAELALYLLTIKNGQVQQAISAPRAPASP